MMTEKKKNNLKRNLFILTFIILPTLHFLIFYVFVNINSFVMGFQETINGKTSWTLNNFITFFQELRSPTTELSIAFKNTFLTFLVQQLLFPVSFLVSYFLYKKIFLYRFFRVCFFLPGLIAGTVVASIYQRIVGVGGPIAPIVQKIFHLSYEPTLLADSSFANATILANVIWLGFPGNMIIWGGAFSRIPDSVIESARLDGVNWFQEGVRIIIPIIWPTFSLLFLLGFVQVFGATGNVFLFTQGRYGTQTLSCWMYMQVYNSVGSPQTSNAYNYLSAVGLLISIVSVALSVVIRKITGTAFTDVQY